MNHFLHRGQFVGGDHPSIADYAMGALILVRMVVINQDGVGWSGIMLLLISWPSSSMTFLATCLICAKKEQIQWNLRLFVGVDYLEPLHECILIDM